MAAKLTGFGDEWEERVPDVSTCSLVGVAAETGGSSATCSGLPSNLWKQTNACLL